MIMVNFIPYKNTSNHYLFTTKKIINKSIYDTYNNKCKILPDHIDKGQTEDLPFLYKIIKFR